MHVCFLRLIHCMQVEACHSPEPPPHSQLTGRTLCPIFVKIRQEKGASSTHDNAMSGTPEAFTEAHTREYTTKRNEIQVQFTDAHL